MGIVSFSAPYHVIQFLQNEYRIEKFVETGTYRGDTAAWAATQFPEVVTVEASLPLYKKATKRFRDVENIILCHKDSRSCLAEIVPKLTKEALFWLDSHWCGELTAKLQTECPLLEEIQIINTSPLEHFVLIDDARLFTSPPPKPSRPEDWPDIETVISTLQSGAARYHVMIAEDVIFAVPPAARETMKNYYHERNTLYPHIVLNCHEPYAKLSAKGHLVQAFRELFRSFLLTRKMLAKTIG